MLYLGLGKTLYNSSVCALLKRDAELDIEIALSERLLRKKATGVWPERALRTVLESVGSVPSMEIAENRDVITPDARERDLDKVLPFYSHLKAAGLGEFTQKFNPKIKFVSHHLAHAYAALALSPFRRCLILVVDGAGSAFPDVMDNDAPFLPRLGGQPGQSGSVEECSIYLLDQGKLSPLIKRWRNFEKLQILPRTVVSEGVGIFYETIAKYLFNSERAAGKVMGLAALSEGKVVANRVDYLKALDWGNQYLGHSATDWDQQRDLQGQAQIAADAQASFEDDLMQTLRFLRSQYSEVESLIITGGCALNCTFNGKLLREKIFREVHVPAFPGDESIGLGTASFLYHSNNAWRTVPHSDQHAYYGPKTSTPQATEVAKTFKDFKLIKPLDIADYAADRLAQGKILGWFQGRSESGPRALGNRSILADPRIPGLKNRLNRSIKFREDFRPYGSSCLYERSHEYFEVDPGFNNPFMSFAVFTRRKWRERLNEVTHADGTSRIQTVRRTQNPRFYDLLQRFDDRTGLACLLNTSLNVMGEPIVETVADAKNFLLKTPVDGLVIGDFYVERPN